MNDITKDTKIINIGGGFVQTVDKVLEGIRDGEITEAVVIGIKTNKDGTATSVFNYFAERSVAQLLGVMTRVEFLINKDIDLYKMDE